MILLLSQFVAGMQIAIRKQADTYFQSVTDVQQAHSDAQKTGKLDKFYTLLLSRYLGTDELITKIITLFTSKKIIWGPFIDATWAYSLNLAEDGASFKALAQFVAQIDRKNMVDRAFLLRGLPENVIDGAGLEKRQTLEKKAQRAYTKFYYDQKKHNLLRENNEGWARLCLLLASMSQAHEYEVVWNKILSLIGNFDLDPDRVLDLLIESYVQSTHTQLCLKIIHNFNPQSIVALIGNRILRDCPPQFSEKLTYAGKVQNFITGTPEQLYKEIGNMVNPKLIVLICKLIKMNFIPLEAILPYLNPSDSILERQQIKRLNNGKQKIAKSFKLLMQQLTPQQQAKLKQQENLKFYGQLLHSSKLALLNGFVQLNDWHHFTRLWVTYQEKIDLVIYQPLLKTLFDMLEWVIDGLYSKISLNAKFRGVYGLKTKFETVEQSAEIEEDKGRRRQMTQCKELSVKQFEKIVQLVQIIKIYIGFNSRLYIKICRLLTSIIKQPHIFTSNFNPNSNQMMPQNEPSIPQSILHQIEQIIKLYLLPGMSLQVGNPALNKELYQLLEMFDYRFRYRCYLYHYYEGMTTNPCLANIFYKTRNKQIVVVNNLSDKNKKIFMKKMAKLTHNQALQTFYWIFRRILMEDYEKVVPEIVGVLANCCPLTLQMTIFIALHILNEQKQPAMNFKTGEQTPWFKNLINYISLFYRKYLEIDIQPVFDYIIMKIGQDVAQLENNEELPGALLGLLHQILSKMFCNFVMKEVNKSKLEMLCAGPFLQLEAMDISSQIRASKKSKVILQKFFWGKSVDQYDGQSLAISLLVLLTQKRAEVLHKSYISNLKIIGDIYDDYTTLIIQLIRVLNELAVDYNQYSKLLPQNSLNLLINEYKLPLEIAFEIYRPSIKHISSMTTDQWNSLVNYVGTVMSKFVVSQEKYINGYGQNQNLKAYLNENYSRMASLMPNQFFTTFWMLTLDSIYFPAKLYTEKIEQVKKKAQVKPSRSSKNERNEREIQKAKLLYQNLKSQEIKQSKKVQDTTNETFLSKLKLDYFKNGGKDDKSDKSGSIAIQQFAQIFTQVCLLPRMMLDPEQALYCMKITLEVIKLNKVSSGKNIKLLIFIIEHVMNSLPYATQRQASYCLAIFLSEILSVIANWNDQAKLQQDLKKWLAIDELFVEENYSKLKKQFIKLYVRFGNIVKSIKDEPYNIKNCLYLLEKVDIIPAYKKQAEELENYLKQLKEKYAQSLQTIIEMQLSIIGQKKKTLPVIEDETSAPQVQNQPVQKVQFPSFSNLTTTQPNLQPPKAATPAPVVSPQRSPIRNKNEFVQRLNNDKGDRKNQGRRDKESKGDTQKQSERNEKPERPKYKAKEPQKQRQKQKQHISTKPEPEKEKPKLSTPVLVENESISSKQNGHKQAGTNGNRKQQTPAIENTNSVSIDSEKVSIPSLVQVSIQKKDSGQEVQKQKQAENKTEQPAITERIKTVKQIRDQNARKAALLSSSMPAPAEGQSKQVQPQQNEKLRKQSLKDQAAVQQTQPRNQKAQWPKQTQKEEKQKSTLPVVQFSRKNSLEDRRGQPNSENSRLNHSMELESKKETRKQETMSPIVQIKQVREKEERLGIINETIKSIQEKREQETAKQKQTQQAKLTDEKDKDKDKSQDRHQRQKLRQEKFGWKKTEKQDKYSQEKNQDKQRQYKRYDKREKDSRWKDRQDHRDKHNEDRRKDESDRSRRKQDKYQRDNRDRKNEHKGKDRDRDHDYRK